LVSQAFTFTKPGGWVEFQDWDTMIYSADGSITKETALFQFHDLTCGRRGRAGFDPHPGRSLEKWVKNAGFINVGVHKLLIPLGTWPKDQRYKEIGALNYLQFDQAMESIAIGCLSKTEGEERCWTLEEVTVLVARARADLKSAKLHGQYDFYVVYGQKPPTGAAESSSGS